MEETGIRQDKMPIYAKIIISKSKRESESESESELSASADEFKLNVNTNDTFEDLIREACWLNWQDMQKFSRVKFSLCDKMLLREDMKETIGDLGMSRKNCTINIEESNKNDKYTFNLDTFRLTEKQVEQRRCPGSYQQSIKNEGDINNSNELLDENDLQLISNNDKEIDTSLRKINWPRIIVGGVTLLLLAVTATLFLLFFFIELKYFSYRTNCFRLCFFCCFYILGCME